LRCSLSSPEQQLRETLEADPQTAAEIVGALCDACAMAAELGAWIERIVVLGLLAAHAGS